MAKKVLIVDKDESLRYALQAIFSNEFGALYSYEDCASGEELVDKLSKGGLEEIALLTIDEGLGGELTGSQIIGRYGPCKMFNIIFYYRANDNGDSLGKTAITNGASAFVRKTNDAFSPFDVLDVAKKLLVPA